MSDERQIKVAASLGRILLTMDFDFSDMCGECKKMKTGIVLLHSNNPLDTNKLLARLIKELIKKDIQLLHHITVVSFKEVKQVC